MFLKYWRLALISFNGENRVQFHWEPFYFFLFSCEKSRTKVDALIETWTYYEIKDKKKKDALDRSY